MYVDYLKAQCGSNIDVALQRSAYRMPFAQVDALIQDAACQYLLASVDLLLTLPLFRTLLPRAQDGNGVYQDLLSAQLFASIDDDLLLDQLHNRHRQNGSEGRTLHVERRQQLLQQVDEVQRSPANLFEVVILAHVFNDL